MHFEPRIINGEITRAQNKHKIKNRKKAKHAQCCLYLPKECDKMHDIVRQRRSFDFTPINVHGFPKLLPPCFASQLKPVSICMCQVDNSIKHMLVLLKKTIKRCHKNYYIAAN